jgi:hypothetical protein
MANEQHFGVKIILFTRDGENDHTTSRGGFGQERQEGSNLPTGLNPTCKWDWIRSEARWQVAMSFPSSSMITALRGRYQDKPTTFGEYFSPSDVLTNGNWITSESGMAGGRYSIRLCH